MARTIESLKESQPEITGSSSVQCCICMEVFSEPKTLPCCHTFCKKCLVKLIADSAAPCLEHEQETDKDSKQSLTCPQCRAEHTFNRSEVGIDSLPTDFPLESQIKKQGLSRHPTEKGTVLKGILQVCDSCDAHDTAKHFCDTCLEYLCEECSKSHSRMKRFRGHKLTKISEIELDQQNVQKTSSSRSHYCNVHGTERIQLYCNSCDELVCVKCVVTIHKDHDFLELNSTTRTYIDEELTKLATPVNELLQSCQNNMEYVSNVEKVTNDMASDLQSKINQAFDSYIATLETRRATLLAESEKKCDSMLKALLSEKESLKKASTELTGVLRLTEQIQKCTDINEFLSLASQALPRLVQLKTCTWNDSQILKVERCLLDFQMPNELKSDVGTIVESHLPLCKFDIPKTIFSGIQQEIRFVILKRGKNCRSIPDTTPSVSITSLSVFGSPKIRSYERREQPRSIVVVVSNDPVKSHDAWIATFTPANTGRHQLTVSIGGAHSTTSATFEVVQRRKKRPSSDYLFQEPLKGSDI